MAVAFDAVAPSSSGTTVRTSGAGTALTWSHTTAGTNRAVVVAVSFGAITGSDASSTLSATFGGVAMTQLALVHSNNQTAGFEVLFGLVNPPTGASTVAVSVAGSGGLEYSLVGGSTSLTGVDQTTPFGTAVTAFGSSGIPSVTVTSASGGMVVDVVGNGSAVSSSGQTDRWLNNFDTGSAAGNAASSTAAGASSVTMSYTVSSDWWGIAAVPVNPATATITGTGALTLGAVVAHGSNTNIVTGGGNATLGAVKAAATGTVKIAGTGALTLGAVVARGLSFLYLAGVHSSGRYFVDQNGNPFLVRGDSAWSIISNANPSDWATYLTDRAAQGINTLTVDLIIDNNELQGRSNGSTYDGIVPFSDSNFTPNEPYWERVDAFLQAASEAGFTLFIVPVEAYTTESGALFASMTTTQATAYGTFLADRYPQSTYPQVSWLVANDYNVLGNNKDPMYTSIRTAMRATGDTRMWSVEFQPNQSYSTDTATWAGIDSWNGAYTYYVTYQGVLTAYAYTPTLPAVFIEGAYDEATTGWPSDPIDLRKQIGWTLTSGGCGSFTGNDLVWPFTGTWTTHLTRTVMTQLKAMQDLFAGLAWWKLVPDAGSHLVTAGRGTQITANNSNTTTAQNSYVTAAVTADGTLAVIYNPDSSTNTSVTLSTTPLGSSPTLTRVDPTTGTQTSMTWTTTLTNPGANAGGDHDWLYLITATASAVTGSGAAVLGPVKASGTGTLKVTGTGAATLGPVQAAATGTEKITGTGSGTLGAVVAAGTAVQRITGTGAAALGPVTAAGAGTFTIPGTGAVTLPAVIAQGSNSNVIIGSGNATLPAATAAATGTVTITGSGAGVLGAPVAAASGTVTVTGSGAAVLGAVVAAGTSAGIITGTAALALGALVAAGTAHLTIPGVGAAVLGAVTVAGSDGSTVAVTPPDRILVVPFDVRTLYVRSSR